MYRYGILLCTILASNCTYACFCVSTTVESAFLRAEGVYIVQIRRDFDEVIFNNEKGYSDDNRLKRTYGVVARNYKGPELLDIDVYFLLDASINKCFIPVEIGETYIIFTKKNARPIVTFCGSSTTLDRFTRHKLKKLNELSKNEIRK